MLGGPVLELQAACRACRPRGCLLPPTPARLRAHRLPPPPAISLCPPSYLPPYLLRRMHECTHSSSGERFRSADHPFAHRLPTAGGVQRYPRPPTTRMPLLEGGGPVPHCSSSALPPHMRSRLRPICLSSTALSAAVTPSHLLPIACVVFESPPPASQSRCACGKPLPVAAGAAV